MDINKTLARAQELMLSDEFNALVESKAAGYSHSKNIGTNVDLSKFEKQAFGTTTEEQPKPKVMLKETTRLPAEIASKAGIPMPAIPMQMTSSVNLEPPKELYRESVSRVSSPQQNFNNSSIDYSLIKTIIDESVRSNIEALKNVMLNEETIPVLRGLRIGEGNKIALMDTKGNLYEGVLKLKKKSK